MGWFKCFQESEMHEMAAAEAQKTYTRLSKEEPPAAPLPEEKPKHQAFVEVVEPGTTSKRALVKSETTIITEVLPFQPDEVVEEVTVPEAVPISPKAPIPLSEPLIIEKPQFVSEPNLNSRNQGWEVNKSARSTIATSRNLHPNATPIPHDLFNGSRSGAFAMFQKYDLDKDGFLLKQDLARIFRDLRFDISQELFNQLLDCNFVYADRDHDNKLGYEEFSILYKMLSDTTLQFEHHDSDKDGMINKAQFGEIITELNLHLEPTMLKHYVDLNFRFADRAMRGVISVGQFLACYANFLYSHAVTVATTKSVAPSRRESQVQPTLASKPDLVVSEFI